MNKEIGLIIPAYNAHDTIKKLLHSICMFSFVDKVDILLVDDNSEKDYEYLQNIFQDLNLTIIRLEKNYGPGYARNLGINWAIEKRLPYLMFADADDYFINIDFWDKISDEHKKNNDLFIFNFIDEGAGGQIKDIDVWCFAKIYKREIIEKYKIYFSENYSNEDVINENSNKNSTLISTQRDLIAGEVSKDIARRILIPSHIVQAHDEGILHYHDQDYTIQKGAFNCCLINLEDMLQNGTVINKKLVEKPKSFGTACTVTTQIIAQIASGQYGKHI